MQKESKQNFLDNACKRVENSESAPNTAQISFDLSKPPFKLG
ncbi:hypothetical protein HFN_1559 [Helicobacter fennelliae MRY12-0050]|uniref:Uncharacterized protein n=1 Tax=Helicobacter fennelliae MRY12-0050 TaxID=1325130 RepID=T1CW12_9HELI|nr:hypothetical protein HFN_1559 [Helicobacter fennelliae MRY12-0050]